MNFLEIYFKYLLKCSLNLHIMWFLVYLTESDILNFLAGQQLSYLYISIYIFMIFPCFVFFKFNSEKYL